MKLTDVIKDEKLSLSFEVFPPKTDAAFDGVLQATEEIANIPGRLPAGCRTRRAWKRWPT